MAIKIEIPGVGEVSVEGAAQEDTLQAILAAISKTEKSKLTEERKLAKAKSDELVAIKKATSELDRMADELDEAEKNAKRFSNSLEETGETIVDASKETAKQLGSFAATLALTATSVAVGFAKNFNENAANPIAVGAALINTGIDLLGAGLKIGVEAVSAFGGALVGAIPLIGGGLQRGVDGMAAVSKEIIDLGTTVLKAGNDIMSAEFQMTTKVMADMAKSGASFANGMTEMRQIANESGIGIEQFSKVIANSRDSITGMGLSATEATYRLSKGMGALATTFGKSGNNLRGEMLALGYSYTEQGEIMASYAAQQRAAGRLKNMTDTELAQGTAQYAKDLKVLADITGKDAKKAMEDANKVALEADIMGQLKPEEKEKFIKAYASMPDYAKKGFLQYVSSGGQAISDATTNVLMVQNSKVEDLIKGTFNGIKDASKTSTQVQNETLKRASEAGVAQRALSDAQGSAIVHAQRMGAVTGGWADAINQVAASALYNADAVDASSAAATANAETRDPVTAGFVKATDAVVAFQAQMANLATELMPEYATMIGKTTEETAKLVTTAMDFASGKITREEFAKRLTSNTEGKKTKIDILKEQRETAEDALKESQAKLPNKANRIASRGFGWDASTENSIADSSAGPEVQKEIAERKAALQKAREMEDKVREANVAYKHGLQDVLDGLRKHATAEEKQAATLEFNRKFIEKSQAEDPTGKENMLDTKTYMPVNIKGTAEYFKLPTEPTPVNSTPGTKVPANSTPAEPAPTTGVPTVKETGQAKGGVSVGPTSGYHELLHGTEAVVPLPDNKSIPVKLDSSSLNATLHEHTGILNNILASLNKGNSLSSGILQNSY